MTVAPPGDDDAPPPDPAPVSAVDEEPAAARSIDDGGVAVPGALLKRLRDWRAVLIPQGPEYHPQPWRRAYLLATFVVRRFTVEDRCTGMAAILTIHTLLSTVPIAGVALLAVGLMPEAEGARRLTDLFISFVPETDRASQMAEGAMELAGRVTVSNLGAWGFLVALVIGFVLFANLEKTFNRIWRVQRARNLLIRFMMFYSLATLGPALMFYSLAQQFFPGLGIALGVPWIVSSAGFVSLNRFLPYAQVRWRGALVGGLVTATIFELGKVGFGLYATRFALATYEGLYGSLAILPIFIVWSYLSWMLVLLGAEIAYTVQHRRPISLMGYMNRYVLERLAIQGTSGRTAARLLLAICDQFARRKIGLSAENLASRFGIGLDVVGEIMLRLHQSGLVLSAQVPHEVYLPARPLDQVSVRHVIALFDADHTRRAREDRLTDLFADLDAAGEEKIGSTTYADLVSTTRSSLE